MSSAAGAAALVSNLYRGRVTRVLPGMQAAFIDIGLERTAFLHAADIASPPPDETVVGLAQLGAPPVEDVRHLLSPGDDILVQVIKDPIGTKGARLTTYISLPARFLVYLPRGDGIGVSTTDRGRGRAPAPEGGGRGTARCRGGRRLHPAHRGAGRADRESARGHGVSAQAVAPRARARNAVVAGHAGT